MVQVVTGEGGHHGGYRQPSNAQCISCTAELAYPNSDWELTLTLARGKRPLNKVVCTKCSELSQEANTLIRNCSVFVVVALNN